MSYGTTISTEDSNFTGRIVGGIESVAEAIIRRLSGRCWYSPTYGFPITELVNSNLSNGIHIGYRSVIAAQVKREQFVEWCIVDTSFLNESLTVNIPVKLRNENNTYQLVLDVSSDGLEISEVSRLV